MGTALNPGGTAFNSPSAAAWTPVLFSATAAAAACTAEAASYTDAAVSTIKLAQGILIVSTNMIMHCRAGLRAPGVAPRRLLLLESLALCCCCALRRCATRTGMPNNRRFAVGLAAASLPLPGASERRCSCMFTELKSIDEVLPGVDQRFSDA
jgi:hypothetical protein